MYSTSSSGKRAPRSAVVEHLDLEPVARVADAGDRVEEPLDHVHLVEQRQLHRDDRQLREPACGTRPPVLVPVVHRDEGRAMEPVDRKNDQDGEVSPDDQTGNRHAGHPKGPIVIEL
jgi:hypothetical protein